MSNALQTVISKLANKLEIGDASGLVETLKQTAFKSDRPVSDDQMTALVIVANQYGLNPWTKEIYAFPDKNGGIVPVVGVDGWSRIINSHPQFDGIEFEQDAESCTAIIYRKDRSHATRVTEYLAECKKNSGPWTTHPRRMLRHKAMIQGIRIAFGYVGIYDDDEASRIIESQEARSMPPTPQAQPAEKPPYSDQNIEANKPQWSRLIASGKKTPQQIIDVICTKNTLTEEQMQAIRDLEPIDVTTTTAETEGAAA